MGEITFQVEAYSRDLLEEAYGLMMRYHDEVASVEGSRLMFDHDQYQQAADAGFLRVITAREDDTLVGFSVALLGCHPHAAHEIRAHQTALYLSPESRRGPVGLELIRLTDRTLQADGVGVIFRNDTPKRRLRAIFNGMGYEECDVVYSRRLNPPPARTILGSG